MPDASPPVRRIRCLATQGLAASLAAMVVMLIFGAGAHPLIALGGLALVSVAFAAILIDPDRALASAAERRSLPPSRRGE